MKDCIYYGSYLIFPCMIFLWVYRKKVKIYIFLLLFIGCFLFLESRFIEPQIIITRNINIEVGFTSKIALISDIHLGRYKGKYFNTKLVKKLNSLDVDYIFLAGDLTYEPQKGELEELFAPFEKLEKPLYWVLGNHDVQRPGPDLREELIDSLNTKNITFLNNQSIKLQNFTLIGLGSNWNNEDKTSMLKKFKGKENIVVLMHNPDSSETFPQGISDIAFAGHTHGGQIRIPILYKKAIPTKGIFDRGYSQEVTTKLYITSGLGEVGLPMRFLNPPVIDVIHLY